MTTRFRKEGKHMRTRTALMATGAIALASGAASAATYSFAGFSFDQDRATDTLGLLGNGDTLGGAAFSAGTASRITRSVGFVAISGNANSGIVGQAGFDPARSLGRQGYAQHSITQDGGAPNGTNNSLYASAINLPNNNDGGSRRHGLEMSWSGNRALANGAGADFLVYESASSAGGFEAFMIRGRDANTGAWSNWYYQAADGFELYTGTTSEGAHSYGFDMSDLGFAAGALVDAVQLANMRTSDRIAGADGTAGFVSFDGTGVSALWVNGQTTGAYGGSAYDPDPLYAVALGDLVAVGNVIPLPTGGAMGLAGMLVLGARRRRSA
jgi:hypothetical protein